MFQLKEGFSFSRFFWAFLPTTINQNPFNRKERKVCRKVRKELGTISFDIDIELSVESVNRLIVSVKICEIRGKKPKTQNPKPRTHNLKPTTHNLKPTT